MDQKWQRNITGPVHYNLADEIQFPLSTGRAQQYNASTTYLSGNPFLHIFNVCRKGCQNSSHLTAKLIGFYVAAKVMQQQKNVTVLLYNFLYSSQNCTMELLFKNEVHRESLLNVSTVPLLNHKHFDKFLFLKRKPGYQRNNRMGKQPI